MTLLNSWTCPRCGTAFNSNRPKNKPTSCCYCQQKDFDAVMDKKPHDISSEQWVNEHKHILHQY